MTYQELLDAFDERRMEGDNEERMRTLQWVILSMLEKLRDGDKE